MRGACGLLVHVCVCGSSLMKPNKALTRRLLLPIKRGSVTRRKSCVSKDDLSGTELEEPENADVKCGMAIDERHMYPS